MAELHFDSTQGTAQQARTGVMASMPNVGPGYVPAYQAGADPYFEMVHLKNTETIRKIEFSRVTKFIEVTNHTSGTVLRIAVTENGAANTATKEAYYDLSGALPFRDGGSVVGHGVPQKFGPFDIRTKVLYLSASNGNNIDAGVFAGLTCIPNRNMFLPTGSDGWDGVG